MVEITRQNYCPGIFFDILGILSGSGEGVKTEEGEEDGGRPGEDPLDPVRQEGVPVAWPDVLDADDDEEEDDEDLDPDQEVVDQLTLAGPPGEDDGHQEDHQDGRQVDGPQQTGSSELVRQLDAQNFQKRLT